MTEPMLWRCASHGGSSQQEAAGGGRGVTSSQPAVLRHMRAEALVLLGKAHRATTGKRMGGASASATFNDTR